MLEMQGKPRQRGSGYVSETRCEGMDAFAPALEGTTSLHSNRLWFCGSFVLRSSQVCNLGIALSRVAICSPCLAIAELSKQMAPPTFLSFCPICPAVTFPSGGPLACVVIDSAEQLPPALLASLAACSGANVAWLLLSQLAPGTGAFQTGMREMPAMDALAFDGYTRQTLAKVWRSSELIEGLPFCDRREAAENREAHM